jgi:hypothetical protein
MTARWLALGMTAALGVLSGCGNDCEALCEEQARCPDVILVGSCEDFCDTAGDIVDAAGCETEWEALISCQLEQGDYCSPDPNACKAENEAYFNACPSG